MRKIVGWAVATWSLVVGVAHAQPFAVRLQAELRVPDGTTGALPLVEERLRVEIDGQHATTDLRQVYRNTTGAALEGRYVLRTSTAARVTGFAYYVGEERIVGEVLERGLANQVYDEVTSVRRDPAILEQTAEGEVTFRVFPIQPAEDKRVELTFSEWLPRRSSVITYRAPLGSPEADVEVVLRDPRARDVRSPTHALEQEPLAGGGLRIRTRGATGYQGELVLRYRVEEPPFALSAHVHRDEGHAGYFVLSVAAPPHRQADVAPKDVTLVLDRSGSMSGPAIESARQAALNVIQRLGHEDRVNVISFDDDVDPLYLAPRAADVSVRADAMAYVSRLTAGGGTDIALALTRALDAQHDTGRPRVIILLTDGQSAPEPVLRLAEEDRRDVRVFTVGVGNGVNRPLLSRLAAQKRGRFTFIPDVARIEAEVGHLYAQIAEPLLVDVSLEVEGAVASRIYPRTLPDLFVDDELTVAGRLRAEGEGPVSFVLRGRVGNERVELRAAVPSIATVERPWVGRRWAVARVDDLLEEIQLKGEQPEVRDEVVSLALAYDFVTPYTAFLAIPERELTAAAASVLDRARGQRAAAQAQHLDAMALSGGSGEAPTQAQYSIALPAADVSRAGCASCAVGAPRDPALPMSLALSLLAIVLVRRRGRS
jgi:Ca-activated chloride channel family protein